MELSERVAACVLGLAVGDALGAPFESLRRHQVPDPLPAFELPWRGRPPGSTTDATAMARNLVRSLAARGSFDPDDLASRHLEWFRSDPPGVESLVGRVLPRVADGQRAPDAARAVWETRGPEASAGNGSVMYCAPLGAAYANRPRRLLELAPLLSALTHHDGRCRTAVLAVTLSVAALIRGEHPEDAVGGALEAVADREGGEELEFLVQEAGRSRHVDGPDRGFCLFAAAVGLQAALSAAPVEETLRRVVALGGDTASNAAVAGALLGARGSRAALPARWLEHLRDRQDIEREALGLVELSSRTDP